jgi:predicted nucleic acid-binding protein
VLIEVPFDRHVAQALRKVERSQVPDLPDRIIAATALHLGLPLISRDGKIQLADVNTIW